MEDGQNQKTQGQVTSIWQELDNWAQGFMPWQRFVLAHAVRVGRLTDIQINQAYSIFLHHNELAAAPNPPIDVPATTTGRPVSAAPTPIWLNRIGNLNSINALPPKAALTFTRGLTVIYGGNGVGKSGFARILSNVCFSRTQHAILPNIYQDQPQGQPTAEIAVEDGTKKEDGTKNERIFVFDGITEHPELKRIAVFDTAVARTHLVDQSPLGFKPAGFDVFPEMARVYAQLADRLTADIDRRNVENSFVKSFVEPESAVSKFVASLNADTNLETLKAFAVFGEAETARLEEVQRQIKDLQSKSVVEAIKQLTDAKRDVGVLEKRVLESRALLAGERRAAFRGQLLAFTTKAKIVAEQGAESFKVDFFKSIGTPEWESFLTAANALASLEDERYPQDNDHCLLCHRPLDEASAALIRRFWGFLTSDARRDAEEASANLDKTVKALKEIKLDYFSSDTTVRAHLTRLDPTLSKRIDELVSAMEVDRASILKVLENAAGEISASVLDDVSDAMTAFVTQIDTDVARLKEQKVEDAIKALESERITLRHRQVLSRLLADVEKFVAGLSWNKAASGAPRRSLNPRPLTDKESDLFTTVIATSYRARLVDECKALDCNLPVEFRTQGQRGQTVRSLSIKGGHSPDKILSEGEQRAVALADFLSEIGLNAANAGIVLDDPVTSQDHERKNRVAHRLVAEAKVRQVVIFTHDLVFLTMVGAAAADSDVDMLTHWVERDAEGRPGQISLDDCPATTPQYRNTQKAQKTLGEAKTATGSKRLELIQRGMGELRRTVEEIVPFHLLKQVVNRWSDRIMITSLKKVIWDDALIGDIIQTFEDISAYIEGHSHTEEKSGAPPEPKNLEAMVSRVDDLIKRTKAEKPKAASVGRAS